MSTIVPEHIPGQRTQLAARPDFSINVAPGGYAWWYLDGLSHDGRFGITLIAFVGSVFSPYYARRRRRASNPDPEAHVAVNVALYNPAGNRWCMTERTANRLQRSTDTYRLHNSSLVWSDSDGLTVEVDERTAPGLQRLRGRVRLRPQTAQPWAFAIAARNDHLWHPIAPHGDIEVDFPGAGVKWRGSGYFDHNRGAAALEADFRYWTWSRRHTGNATEICYETWEHSGHHGLLALRALADGRIVDFQAPARTALPATSWGISRNTRVPDARIARTLENTPFYARSVLHTNGADPSHGMIENLDLQRFGKRWVQTLLPFRMPRNRS